MIKTFGSKETEKIWNGVRSLRLPDKIQPVVRRKLRMLNNSVSVTDLRIPPSNKLEKLSGKLKEYYSIRINDPWKVIFKWREGHSFEVGIIGYHQ